MRPTTRATVHGLEVDTKDLYIRLPPEKLTKAHEGLDNAIHRRKLPLRDLQSLLGYLNFACRTVVPGRPFLRRLFDRTRGVTAPHHYITLNAEARADIAAWKDFITHHNGKTMLLDYHWLTSPKLQLYSDASGAVGFAAYFGPRWVAGRWPDAWRALDITFKELFPIVVAVIVWVEKLSNKCISFHTDNIAVAHIVNSQTSKNPAVMFLVRKLVITCMNHNIMFRASHVPGLKNNIADALSRFQLTRARSLARWLQQDPTPLSPDFSPENIRLKAFWLHP